jgi:Bacterial archaeo-eukaryotic release factor family 3
MKTFTRNDLSQLAEARGDHLISLYMPTFFGPDAQQNAIRYKNLIREAEDRLTRRGVRPADARKLLATASDLLDETTAWGEQGSSLAVFVEAGGVRTWRLRAECDEVCTVGEYFHVLPLVEWLSHAAPYYVLAVSQNEVKFFYGTRGGIEEVEVAGLPANREEALRLDDPEPSRQQHPAQRGTPGKQGLVFHGQGGAPDASKQEILAFFREIDRALSDTLRQRSEPLIFVGVDYLFPIYQEANRYPHLVSESVAGNPELWSPADIQERTWPLVEAMIEAQRESTLAAYGNAIPAGQAVERVEDVLLAAHAGAVDTLFIDPSAQVVGAFDMSGLTVSVGDAPNDDSEDLMNLAAVLVLRSSGTVEPLESGKVPGGRDMAAVLRYPFPSAEKVTPAASSR